MVYKNGKCRLVGFVDLGKLHDNMTILTGILSPKSESEDNNPNLRYACISLL